MNEWIIVTNLARDDDRDVNILLLISLQMLLSQNPVEFLLSFVLHFMYFIIESKNSKLHCVSNFSFSTIDILTFRKAI